MSELSERYIAKAHAMKSARLSTRAKAEHADFGVTKLELILHYGDAYGESFEEASERVEVEFNELGITNAKW